MGSEVNMSAVEDLVAYTVSQGVYDSTAKWKLVGVVDQEWDDPAAGKAWEAEDTPRWNTPEYEELYKRRPARHVVTKYRLEQTGEHYHYTWIHLNGDLGAQVWAAWPKRQSRYGNREEPSGPRTLAGLLKLMGRGEVGKQIEAARAEQKRREDEQRRANVKAHIEKAARELQEYMSANDSLHDVASVTITKQGLMFQPEHKEN